VLLLYTRAFSNLHERARRLHDRSSSLTLLYTVEGKSFYKKTTLGRSPSRGQITRSLKGIVNLTRKMKSLAEVERRKMLMSYRGSVRTHADNIPPATLSISSPYDLDAHYGKKHSTSWVGFKVHLTEMCENLHEGDTEQRGIPVEASLDFSEKNGMKKTVSLPEETTTVPLDIALSLLRPDELEKLKKYVASYLAKQGGGEVR
jgi:hypothetical protein